MNDTVYTWEEVAKHKSKQDGVWVVVHNEVYDVTKFLDDVSAIKLIAWFLVGLLIYFLSGMFYCVLQHPGGEEVILEQAGKIILFTN